MANALETLFTETANSIRGGLPDVGKMSPSVFPEKIDEIVANGKNPALQEKTVTPTTSQQEVTPDAEYDGLSKVTVEAMQVSNTESPVIEVSDEGLVQASVQHNEGYVAADEKTTSNKQLPTQAAKAVTPSANEQVAVEAGVFTTGAVAVAGDPNLVPENIKSGVSIFGVDGTHEGGIDVTLIEGMEIALDFSAGDQSLSVPDGYAVKSAIIEKPETLIPENIAQGVDIAGVVGTLESGGGEGGELVRYVTFLNEDGTTLYQMPVLVGDTCKDPVTHGDISTPTKESTAANNFTYSGWTSTVGGTADADVLKNITDDKTVYAAYTASVRYYTVNFYANDALFETVQVEYGGTAAPTTTPTKTDHIFSSWEPEPTNVTADMDCYAVWVEGKTFTAASWEEVIIACQSNNVPSMWKIGDSKEMIIGGASYTIDIIGKNKDTYTSGGTAPLTLQLHDCLPTVYTMNDTETSDGGYDSSKMFTTYLPAIKKTMPSDIQAAIRYVNKQSPIGNGTSSQETISCDIFLLSRKEAGISSANDGVQYDYYSDNTSRKKTASGAGTAWWLRSPSIYEKGEFSLIFVGGTVGDQPANSTTANDWTDKRVSFAFCF